MDCGILKRTGDIITEQGRQTKGDPTGDQSPVTMQQGTQGKSSFRCQRKHHRNGLQIFHSKLSLKNKSKIRKFSDENIFILQAFASLRLSLRVRKDVVRVSPRRKQCSEGRWWADVGLSQIVTDCVKQHPWISSVSDHEKFETLTSVVQWCVLATCHSTRVQEDRAEV